LYSIPQGRIAAAIRDLLAGLRGFASILYNLSLLQDLLPTDGQKLMTTLAAPAPDLRAWSSFILPPLLLIIGSFVYYGLYFDVGFNFADEGNYAQFAYELFLGRDLGDLPVSYGVLWFKLGEGLFRVFGPDYALVRLVFFASVLITSLLVYAALALATGHRRFAFAVALIPVLAPAFLPTAFYGLCVLLNAAAQIRLVKRGAAVRVGDAALAGAALALSFQIRPDFGYIFSVPLVFVLVLAAWRAVPEDRLRSMLRLTAGALAGFALAHLPGLMVAVADGYLGVLIAQYLSYPAMLAGYGLRGLHSLFGGASGGEATAQAAALLQRPDVNIFAAPDVTSARLALLVYLPPVIIAAFAVHAVLAYRQAADRLEHVGMSFVVFATGAAALPHYFFYRPDLAHIANFMPGYVVLAGLFAWKIANARRRLAGLIGCFVIAMSVGLYLWAAFTSEGTGSIAGTFGRTERFQAANGVDVRLYPGEKAQLEDLKSLIEAHSAPGDAIICVPYCPGIAFMTGRRLLFREQYVDDALLLREPDWLARASALTQEARPPVVIVMDWAINGTDISRFSRWAAPYMDTLESLARRKLERPNMTIYLL